jgi:tripeptidyl-peptidase-1
MQYRWHWFSTLSFLIAVLLTDLATALEPWDKMLVKHSWNAVPDDWESLGHPPAGTSINLHIALKPELESVLTDALNEISDPRHPRYGAHLSAEQVAELVRPHPDTLGLISAWLKFHGIQSSSISTSHGGGWLTVTDVLVSKANQLLGASYQVYRNTKTNDMIVRTVGYALPAVLHTHIQAVAPTTYFASKQVTWQTPRRRSFGTAPTQAQALSSRVNEFEVVPEFLRWLYKTFAYVPSATDQNRLALVGFHEGVPRQSDLTSFMNLFFNDEETTLPSAPSTSTSVQAATFTVVQVNGGSDYPISLEASSDIQYATAMAFPTPLIFYNVAGIIMIGPNNVPVTGDMYLEWFDHILRERNIPQTISISFSREELLVPRDYARVLCILFAELGVRGSSVLVASGDHGVGRGGCANEEGIVRFRPEFPSSCPWVTSVGGTEGGSGDLPEVAVSFPQGFRERGSSGGGFSDYFPCPWYQNDAVAGFFENFNGNLNPQLYNSTSRGYPDIASQASNFQFFFVNSIMDMEGTSFAVSTVAGIISLINDFRISRNMASLGFLNTWLYREGLEGLKDITSGSNPGCNTPGFPAIPGWDPVTGLGTLNFQTLLTVLPTIQATRPVK